MARNSYDNAFGVARIRWQFGEPTSVWSLVLVEVWESEIVNGSTVTTTQAKVSARVEVRIRVNDDWMRIATNGTLQELKPGGRVRRWAFLPTRNWSKTISLDGWTRERKS